MQYDYLTDGSLDNIEIHSPISPKQEIFLNNRTTDIILMGGAAGSGKSQTTLLRVLSEGLWDRDYVAGIFRKTREQIKGPGSLWPTFKRLSEPLGARLNALTLTTTLPEGNEISFRHLDGNTMDLQGMQLTTALVDEAAQITNIDDIWYILSRLRSKSSKKPQLLMTCNPDKNSELCEWLDKGGYLDDDGLPLAEMDGVETYIVQIAGDKLFFKSRSEIKELYGEAASKSARSFVFYQANVYDNPYITKNLPEYVHNLENMRPVEKARLLDGNWFAEVEESGYLKQSWFQEIDRAEVPYGLPTLRGWDFASTKPSAESRNIPDWTRGVKCSYDKSTGNFYILDMVGVQDRPAVVHELLKATASNDGRETYQAIPLDPGSAGREVADRKRADLLSMSIRCLIDKHKGTKLKKAEPFLIAAQQGKVFVVKGVFDRGNWRELEAFSGERSSNTYKDDIVDALGTAFRTLTGGILVTTVRASSNGRKMVRGNTILAKYY